MPRPQCPLGVPMLALRDPLDLSSGPGPASPSANSVTMSLSAHVETPVVPRLWPWVTLAWPRRPQHCLPWWLWGGRRGPGTGVPGAGALKAPCGTHEAPPGRDISVVTTTGRLQRESGGTGPKNGGKQQRRHRHGAGGPGGIRGGVEGAPIPGPHWGGRDSPDGDGPPVPAGPSCPWCQRWWQRHEAGRGPGGLEGPGGSGGAQTRRYPGRSHNAYDSNSPLMPPLPLAPWARPGAPQVWGGG